MNKRIRKKKGLPFRKVKDSELWNLDLTIAKFILPRLIRFKEFENSHPINFKSVEEWNEVVDKMIWSFEFAKGGYEVSTSANLYPVEEYGERFDFKEYKEKQEDAFKRYEEGMKLFAEYFSDLWI